MSRRMVARIPVCSLLDLITGRLVVVNLPRTAELKSAWLDTQRSRQVLVMNVEDESFEDIPDGRKYPTLKLRGERR